MIRHEEEPATSLGELHQRRLKLPVNFVGQQVKTGDVLCANCFVNRDRPSNGPAPLACASPRLSDMKRDDEEGR